MSIENYNNFLSTRHVVTIDVLEKIKHAEELGYEGFCDYIREKRNTLLAETDWMATSDRTMTQAEIDYRQALRDIPQQEGFPTDVIWPTKP